MKQTKLYDYKNAAITNLEEGETLVLLDSDWCQH